MVLAIVLILKSNNLWQTDGSGKYIIGVKKSWNPFGSYTQYYTNIVYFKLSLVKNL